MRGHGDRGADAKRNGREHGRSDHDAVEEVVEGIADEHHRRRHAVRFAVVRVAMAPQHELFEHEEQHDAREHGTENPSRGEMAEGLRKQVEECHTK